MTTHHPIAIIGGGLGGLVAARVLATRGITATVFDLEASRHARVQGGMLDIHEYNGQKAVHAAGLWDQFTTLIHPGGEAMRILDAAGTVLRDEHDDGDLRRPEVDRGQLRDLLLDALPDGTVQWGKKVTSVEAGDGDTGSHLVEFDDGTSITTDLLIGADGAWSKVRSLLTEDRPAYTGLSFVEVDLFDADQRHPVQAEIMGQGIMFAFQGDTGMIGHRETDGSLHVYLGFRVPQDWIHTIDFTDDAAAKRTVLGMLQDWNDDLRALIADADTPMTPRPINALPVGIRWPRVPGVTLLGDAAHVMSPFAGEGANLAMYDAALLATAIADHPGDTEAALQAYETELFPRAKAAAGESAESLQLLFRDDSPTGLVEMFNAFDLQKAAAETAGTR